MEDTETQAESRDLLQTCSSIGRVRVHGRDFCGGVGSSLKGGSISTRRVRMRALGTTGEVPHQSVYFGNVEPCTELPFALTFKQSSEAGHFSTTARSGIRPKSSWWSVLLAEDWGPGTMSFQHCQASGFSPQTSLCFMQGRAGGGSCHVPVNNGKCKGSGISMGE